MMQNMIAWLRKNWVAIMAVIVVIVLVICRRDNGFFWDSIALISVPANYLYDNGLWNIIMGGNVNVCVATLPQWITAVAWKLFGRSLIVTHFTFLIVAIWMVWELWKLCCFWLDKWSAVGFLLVMMDATLLTQCTGIMPDVWLMASALWAINSILNGEKWKGLFGLLMLAMVSDRGMLIDAALMLWGCVRCYRSVGWKATFKSYGWVVIPTLLYVGGVFVIQRVVDGYWVVNLQEDSPWNEYWQLSNIEGLVMNVGITLLRWWENGRWSVWLGLLGLLVLGRKKVKWNGDLLLLEGCILAVMLLATLLFKNPITSRYYLIFNVLCVLLVVDGLKQVLGKRWCLAVVGCMMACCVGSNWLRYPEKIAVAWDGTLGHLPYYELRSEMEKEVDRLGVDYLKVGVPFPMTNKLKYTYLNGDERRFASIDLEENELVVYSNIGNLDDETIDAIKCLPIVWRLEKGAVFMELRRVVKPGSVQCVTE